MKPRNFLLQLLLTTYYVWILYHYTYSKGKFRRAVQDVHVAT